MKGGKNFGSRFQCGILSLMIYSLLVVSQFGGAFARANINVEKVFSFRKYKFLRENRKLCAQHESIESEALLICVFDILCRELK